MFLLHVLGVAVGCIAVVQKGLVPVLLRQLQGGLPQLVGDLTSLVVLADGIGPGAEDAVDWVLLVPLLLMLHGPVLPAGHAAVLGCDAVAVLGLMSTGRQEIPSAVLAPAGRVDVMHPVQQVKAVKLHRRGKVDPLHEYHLFFVSGALGKHIGG